MSKTTTCYRGRPGCTLPRPHFHTLEEVDRAAKRRQAAEERWHNTDSGALPMILPEPEPWPPEVDAFPGSK